MEFAIPGLEHGEWGLTLVPIVDPRDTYIEVGATSTDVDMVEFCGQKFDPRALLGLPLNMYKGAAELQQFREVVRQLNLRGLAQTELNKRGISLELPPVFFSYGKSHADFGPALERMTETTVWKLEFRPSEINPAKGVDVRVIIPE